MRTKVIKSFALIVLSVICTVMCSGCYLFGVAFGIGTALIEEEMNDANKAFELVGEPTVSCVYNEETKMYDVVVDGTTKNFSDEKWQWVYVTFVLYDENNNTLGTATAYVELVVAQGVWRFCATGQTNYEAVSADLCEVTGRMYY